MHWYCIFKTVLTVQTPAKEGEIRIPQGLNEMSVLTAAQLLPVPFCPVLVALPALYLQSSYRFTGTQMRHISLPSLLAHIVSYDWRLLFWHLILLPANCEVSLFLFFIGTLRRPAWLFEVDWKTTVHVWMCPYTKLDLYDDLYLCTISLCVCEWGHADNAFSFFFSFFSQILIQ